MKKHRFPITIIWPADKPVEAMPPEYHRLLDGQIKAVYHDIDELRTSIHLLTLVHEAQALGGAAAIGEVHHRSIENFGNYLKYNDLCVVGAWEWKDEGLRVRVAPKETTTDGH